MKSNEIIQENFPKLTDMNFYIESTHQISSKLATDRPHQGLSQWKFRTRSPAEVPGSMPVPTLACEQESRTYKQGKDPQILSSSLRFQISTSCLSLSCVRTHMCLMTMNSVPLCTDCWIKHHAWIPVSNKWSLPSRYSDSSGEDRHPFQ